MEISLKTTTDLNSYEAQNSNGNKLQLSRNEKAFGPMESVLAAVAGCSTIDIVMILEKMKQEVKNIEVKVEAKRKEDPPRYFTKIHLHYIISGIVKEKKADQAIQSSLEKYCSVSKMLEDKAKITSSFEILEFND